MVVVVRRIHPSGRGEGLRGDCLGLKFNVFLIYNFSFGNLLITSLTVISHITLAGLFHFCFNVLPNNYKYFQAITEKYAQFDVI